MSEEEHRRIVEQQKDWQRNEEHQAQIRALDKEHWDGVSKGINRTLESRRQREEAAAVRKETAVQRDAAIEAAKNQARADKLAKKSGVMKLEEPAGSFGNKVSAVIVLSGVGIAGLVANNLGVFEGSGIPISLAVGGIISYALREFIKKAVAVLLLLSAVTAFIYIFFPNGLFATLVSDILNL